MSERGVMYLDRAAMVEAFDLLKSEPITNARSAYVDLLVYGPLKIGKSSVVSAMRKWGMSRAVASRILRRLFNKGAVRIEGKWLHAVPLHEATPSAFLEEGGSWARLRQRVFERDGFACTYCGDASSVLHADHIHPRVLGGADEMSNLTTACARCNLSKGPKRLEDWRR